MIRLGLVAAMLLASTLASSCAFARDSYRSPYKPVYEEPAGPLARALGRFSANVMASFYGHGEKLAKRTASGEVFQPLQLTASHRTLPLGTKVAVTYRGKTVVVRINDRGPAAYTGRALDLSYGAARALGLDRAGTGKVQMAVLS